MNGRTVRHHMILLLLALCTILFSWQMPMDTEGCTVILIGKEATSDGSVILAANDDWPGYPSRLVHVPGKTHSRGETFTLVRGGKIPQVRRTCAYNYVCSAYGTGTRNVSWIYGINENQVGGVMWVAFDTPATSVYIPWYLCTHHVHPAYGTGEAGIYDRTSAWWHYQEVGNLCYRRFDRAALVDVIPVWWAFENEELRNVSAIEQKAVQLFQTAGKQSACKYLTETSNRQAEEALQIAERLENGLRGKYLDHTVVDSK